jgi:hypothetical protein
MRRAALIHWCLASVGVWYFASVQLARVLPTVSFDVPLWLANVVRYGFHVVYHYDTPDAGDMDDGVTLFLVLGTFAVVGLVVSLASAFVWRRLSARWFLGR